MANVKITNLPELSFSGLSNDDVMTIVDITSDVTNKVTLDNLKNYFTTNSSRGNLIYVDSVFGNDSTGTTNDSNKPFLTYNAKLLIVNSNDLIVIRPGRYDEKLFKRWC